MCDVQGYWKLLIVFTVTRQRRRAVFFWFSSPLSQLLVLFSNTDTETASVFSKCMTHLLKLFLQGNMILLSKAKWLLKKLRMYMSPHID